MSKSKLTKYEFSFPVAGQASPCYFDVRCLMCKGVPKRYKKSLVVRGRIEYLERVLSYISDRSDAAKRNMFNHFRQYIRWAEENTLSPFDGETMGVFTELDGNIKLRRSINRFRTILKGHEMDGKPIQGKPSDLRVRLRSAKPESFEPEAKRVGFTFSTDGKHRIFYESRSGKIQRMSFPPDIEQLNDKVLLLSSLREVFESYSGETFQDKANNIKHYLPLTLENNTFFSVNALELFIRQLNDAVLRKEPLCNYGRRKAKAVIELFELAEIGVPSHIKKAVDRLPGPHSTPVTAYNPGEYKALIKLLLTVQRQSFDKLMSGSYLGYISGPKTSLPCLGFSDLISIFMESSYYLISRYSAWTDSTIKSLLVSDVVIESQNGEWIHIRGNKPRAGYKDLEITLAGRESDNMAIRKSGYRLIKDILKLSKHFGVHHSRLLYNITQEGSVKPLIIQKRLRKFILGEISSISSLSTQKIRETEIAIAHERGFKAAVERSGSTASVVKRHYSNGNKHNSNVQLSDTTNAILDIAQSGKMQESTSEIKRRLYEKQRIPVLTDKPANTPMGTRCQTPQPKSSFSRKSAARGFGDLSCADLTSCFGCKHAAIIDSVDDLWNLVSFQQRLKEGKVFSVDLNHHKTNFMEVITNIDIALESCTQDNIDKAIEKFNNEGPHPFWAGEEFL